VLTTPDVFDERGQVRADYPFQEIPFLTIPRWDRLLRNSWKLLAWPKVDTRCAPADWLYCPTELYIPTCRARLATSLHAIHSFERELPLYDSWTWRRDRLWWRVQLRLMLQKAQLLLTPSAFLRGRMIELLGADPGRIVTVGNGVEAEYYDIADTPASRSERPYLLAVGGLTHIKGADVLLKTAKALLQRRSELKIVVVGEHDSEFVRQALQMPNIDLRGYVGVASGLPKLIRNAVALVVLSRYESFGIPAAEAMAAGTPVILSRTGALTEVVGDAGLVVQLDDPDGIAHAADDLARDDGRRTAMSARGRHRAEEYRWAACVDRLVDALHRFA
jgi:glycosyltransferase involved in cell wall biosynthesis